MLTKQAATFTASKNERFALRLKQYHLICSSISRLFINQKVLRAETTFNCEMKIEKTAQDFITLNNQ
jgi:hypothetical protein